MGRRMLSRAGGMGDEVMDAGDEALPCFPGVLFAQNLRVRPSGQNEGGVLMKMIRASLFPILR